MTRNIITLIGLALLVGCSGGGGDEAPSSSPSTNNPTPSSPTEFLVATPTGLWRGQANGQGSVIFAQPNFQQQRTLSVNDGRVVYSRTKPTDDQDIWSVNTDGTGNRALVNTQHDENMRTVRGPWMVYSKYMQPGGQEELWSLHIDTGAQVLLYDEQFAIDAQLYRADRVMFMTDYQIFSETVTGTGRIDYVNAMDGGITTVYGWILESALIYGREDISGLRDGRFSQLFAVPLAGGNPVPLDSDQVYARFMASIGNRVIYHRCLPRGANPCDVIGIDTDGTNPVVLADHPANEAVQGVTTSQVIIRRNLSGNDQLVAVPVAGGPEKPLMTMTDNEFVDTIAGDTIIVRRPTGTWTLDLNGNLKQIGTKPGLDFFRVVGDSICSDLGEIWCLPIDGSRAEVRIDRNGKFVGLL